MVVSDTAFYIVLGIAIFLAVFLAYIFYMLKTKFSPEMMRIMTTLHAAIFGYERALIDLIGSRGYRTHVFPEILKVINTLKDDNAKIMDVFGAETKLEAMQKWLEVIADAKIIEDDACVEINEKGETVIDIKKCSMSYPIHEVMGQKKGICPLALIVASASNIVDDTKEPEIAYSVFTEDGTKTVITFKDKE